MKKNVFVLALLASFFVCTAHSQSRNDSLFSMSVISRFPLQDFKISNKPFFIPPGDGKPLLFLFLSTECPLCQNYSSVFNNLYQGFGKEISFYGILPGNTYSQQDIDSFRTAYQIQFPLLVDASEEMTRYFAATVTPEALLLDSQANLLYKGAVDNWLISLGKRRVQPTEHYLQDALVRTIHHTKIKTKRTKAIGCKLNDF